MKNFENFGKYLLITVIALLAIAYFVSKDGNNSPQLSPENREKQEQEIKKQAQANQWNSDKQELIDQFLLSGGEIETEYKKAYVPPGLWNICDHTQKADISCVIAQYCQEKKHDGITYVNLYDKMTGKKLAKWSNTSGLTIE